jgi:hypothetical protein
MPEDPRPAIRKLSSDKPVYALPSSPEDPALHSGWNRNSNPHVPPRPREDPSPPAAHPE